MTNSADSTQPPSKEPSTGRIDDFTADRCRQLHQLSREHNDCLVFAARIAALAAAGSDAALGEGIERVREYNDRELEAHLQHEEQTIFGPLVQGHREHLDLCITLGKEHGLIRTLVERMSPETAGQDLADFAAILKNHTLVEETQLFPLIETLFTDEQLDAVANHVPLHRQAPTPSAAVPRIPGVNRDDHWLAIVEQHLRDQGRIGGTIVLFPGYRPDLIAALANGLGLAFFDYQKEVMEGLGLAAEAITLEQLDQTLRARAATSGFVCHNIEALLCVKSELERRAWLQAFLDADWPSPVLLPITVYQADVPEEHPGVCDLELLKMPGPQNSGSPHPGERIKYDLA